MMKILVISMAGIGDTILATPLIHELRAIYPEARIDALVLWSGSKDILETNPHLTTIYQRNLLKQSKLEALRFLLPLRRVGYDVSINTHPQSRTHYRLISRIVAARLRLSHLYESFGWPDRFLVNRTVPQDYQKHSVENNLALLPLLNQRPVLSNHALEIPLNAADEEWAERFLASNGLAGRQRLGIHAGSGGTKNLSLKRWPLECYTELVRVLKDSAPELSVLLFGGPDEDQEIERLLVESKSPRALRARTGNLRQAGALMRRCDAFLSVDTALMHIAAAVQAPNQIVIEAPTLNKTNEPYGHSFVLIPNPAIGGRNLDYYRYDGLGIKGTPEQLRRLMGAVSVESVHTAVRQALAGAGLDTHGNR